MSHVRKKDLVNFNTFLCANYEQVCITHNTMLSNLFQATYLLVNCILSKKKKRSNFQVHAPDTGPCTNLSGICHQWRLGSWVLLLKTASEAISLCFHWGACLQLALDTAQMCAPSIKKTSYAYVYNFCLCSNGSGIPPFTFDCLQITYVNIK